MLFLRELEQRQFDVIFFDESLVDLESKNDKNVLEMCYVWSPIRTLEHIKKNFSHQIGHRPKQSVTKCAAPSDFRWTNGLPNLGFNFPN